MFRTCIGSLVLAALCQGCGQQAAPPTVSWYEAHPNDRESKVTWCADDMQRMQTPDCMNALAAAQRKSLGSMGDSPPIDWNKPDSITHKP